MKYFSIDYRSPPSGLGQIIDTTKPEKIGDRWNYILVTYSGNGSENDPSYIKTAHFSSQEAYKLGWAGPILPQLFQFLRDQGVTHVYDSELTYEMEGADEDGNFPLDRWIEILSMDL